MIKHCTENRAYISPRAVVGVALILIGLLVGLL